MPVWDWQLTSDRMAHAHSSPEIIWYWQHTSDRVVPAAPQQSYGTGSSPVTSDRMVVADHHRPYGTGSSPATVW